VGKEYSRTQRVGDFLQQELAQLIQRELRDPRVQMVSITGVDVSRDLTHAKVFFTQLGVDDSAGAKATTDVLNKAAGFMRSQLAHGATMRTVPRLHFRFDESVGRGRDMESLLREVREIDAQRATDEASGSDNDLDFNTAQQAVNTAQQGEHSSAEPRSSSDGDSDVQPDAQSDTESGCSAN